MGADVTPSEQTAGTMTQMLRAASAGDATASATLLPLVYQELRKMAASQMSRERADLTLQATALVHEAYLRLVDQTTAQFWDTRGHFFAAAAEAMRRILVDNARRKSRLKRGGDRERISLDSVELTIDDPPNQLVALDEALTEFDKEHSQKARLVKLRYFAGLSMEEASCAMGISTKTAGRYWTFARAWLFARIKAIDCP